MSDLLSFPLIDRLPPASLTCLPTGNKAKDMKLFVVSDIFCKPELPSCLSTRLPLADQVSHHALNELAGRPELSGEALHRYLFQDRGMNKAVATLTEMMTKEKHCFGLGYSAGGTALWKAAAFQAVPLLGLFCVSSTRLRDETAIPVPAHVFFGSQDPGRPSLEWLRQCPSAIPCSKMQLTTTISRKIQKWSGKLAMLSTTP